MSFFVAAAKPGSCHNLTSLQLRQPGKPSSGIGLPTLQPGEEWTGSPPGSPSSAASNSMPERSGSEEFGRPYP